MEDVLRVYTRPYDPRFPQLCMDEISKQLLKIKVRGSFTQPQISKEPVPAVVEPLKVLFKLMGGRQQ